MLQVETQLPPSLQEGLAATPSFRAQAAISNYLSKKKKSDERSFDSRRKLSGVCLTSQKREKQSSGDSAGTPKHDGHEEPRACCGVYSALDTAQTEGALFRACRTAYLWRTVVFSLFITLDGFYAYLTLLGVTVFPTGRFLRALPIVCIADTVLVVVFGRLLCEPPIATWKAWGAGVTSGLRFVLSVGDILMVTFGITALATASPGWYTVKLALEFVVLSVSGSFCALSFKVLEALWRIHATQPPLNKPKSAATVA